MEWLLMFFHLAYLIPKAVAQYVNLESPYRYYIVKSYRCPAVRLEENHQETKAYEYHDMHILVLGVVVGQQSGNITVVCGVRTRIDSLFIYYKQSIEEDADCLADKHGNFCSGYCHL